MKLLGTKNLDSVKEEEEKHQIIYKIDDKKKINNNNNNNNVAYKNLSLKASKNECYESNEVVNDKLMTKITKISDNDVDKGKLVKFFGLCLVFMTVISFLFVGFIINIFQFILLITINLSSNKNWKLYHKKLNGNLLYILYCPTCFLLYYWNNIKLNIKLDNVDLIEDSKKSLIAIMLPNHSYELDYMICFTLSDQLGNIGSYKSLSKDELKYLPIAGWSLWMSDLIFVKRNWAKDRLILESKLNESFNYDQFLLGIFAEGTRFTKEKHEISKNYCLSKNLIPLKYHLEPRSKGFTFAVRYFLKELIEKKRKDINLFKFYNLQMIMKKDFNFRDFIYGERLEANIYCEEIELAEDVCQEVLNSKDEDDCPKLGQFLRKIYERKDEIVEQYKNNNNEFVLSNKNGGTFPFRTRKTPLVVWLLGFCLTYSTFGYLALTIYAKSIPFWTIVISYVTICAFVLKRISYESHSNNNIIAHNNSKNFNKNSIKHDIVIENDENENSTIRKTNTYPC